MANNAVPFKGFDQQFNGGMAGGDGLAQLQVFGQHAGGIGPAFRVKVLGPVFVEVVKVHQDFRAAQEAHAVR
ncbi:hypothetical protein D3C75_1349390 [compost metagenome]